MKKLILAGLVCFGVACLVSILFLILGPEERINNFKEKWRRSSNDPAQICLDYIRKDLQDPDSARLVSYEWKDIVQTEYEKRIGLNYSEGAREIHIIYKAKNIYGDYVRDEDFCVMNRTKGADIFSEGNTSRRKESLKKMEITN
ncbi:MAG: hypothetical protein H6Q57_1484 [Geobacteraceae bacterium]|nr:hypothetical protein [Geobacteraceae bacterium]